MFHSVTLEDPELLARAHSKAAQTEGRISLLRGAAVCLYREERSPTDILPVFHTWSGTDHTGAGRVLMCLPFPLDSKLLES